MVSFWQMDEKEDKEEKEEKEENLEEKVETLAVQIKNMVTSEYMEVASALRNPMRLVWVNFLIGLARGVGTFIGMTILGAIVLIIFTKLLGEVVNMPLIGKFIADLIESVKEAMGK